MTPPPQDSPQTVLDLLFPPGEDGPEAVVSGPLSSGATGDLGRALENVPATLREAAVRETINADAAHKIDPRRRKLACA